MRREFRIEYLSKIKAGGWGGRALPNPPASVFESERLSAGTPWLRDGGNFSDTTLILPSSAAAAGRRPDGAAKNYKFRRGIAYDENFVLRILA